MPGVDPLCRRLPFLGNQELAVSLDSVGTPDQAEPLGEERPVIEGDRLTRPEASLRSPSRREDDQEETQEAQDEGNPKSQTISPSPG